MQHPTGTGDGMNIARFWVTSGHRGTGLRYGAISGHGPRRTSCRLWTHTRHGPGQNERYGALQKNGAAVRLLHVNCGATKHPLTDGGNRLDAGVAA